MFDLGGRVKSFRELTILVGKLDKWLIFFAPTALTGIIQKTNLGVRLKWFDLTFQKSFVFDLSGCSTFEKRSITVEILSQINDILY